MILYVNCNICRQSTVVYLSIPCNGLNCMWTLEGFVFHFINMRAEEAQIKAQNKSPMTEWQNKFPTGGEIQSKAFPICLLQYALFRIFIFNKNCIGENKWLSVRVTFVKNWIPVGNASKIIAYSFVGTGIWTVDENLLMIVTFYFDFLIDQQTYSLVTTEHISPW